MSGLTHTLRERVRFNIEWEHRNDSTVLSTNELINAMTPLELLMAISQALEELHEETDDGGMAEERRRHP